MLSSYARASQSIREEQGTSRQRRQKEQLENLTRLESLVDISLETLLLKEIQDIIDELSIILYIHREKKEVLRAFEAHSYSAAQRQLRNPTNPPTKFLHFLRKV